MIYCRSPNKIPEFWLAALLFFAFDVPADTHKLPVFELGVSLVVLNLPHYRGSAGSTNYLLPLPFIKYRGERFKIDDGVEGILSINEDLILSISGNATAPVADDSPERAGMAELKGSFEIGPSLDYRLYRGESADLWLELPLRLAVTFESSPQAIGRVFNPRLAWDKPYRKKGDWELRLAAGPVYASEQYHDYYYSVDPDEALPTRPAFQAEAGYSGLRADFTYSRRFGDYSIGGFIRFDSLNGSVIESSPLVSDTSVWMAGFAFTRVLITR
ncbi:MAG: MipA/OmpV family protein [Gammaproteobacteria bacterium]